MFQFLSAKKSLGLLLLAIGLVVAMAMPIIYSAWLCDDAFITLRSVKQWASGNGIGFNPNERVMAFTHPVWFLIVSAAFSITGELYQTTILLSISFSLFGLASLAFIGYRSNKALLSLGCVLTLSFSKAFVDYGTSGLENPLAYALFGLLFLLLRYDKNKMTAKALCIGLLFLTRMDFGVLLAPLSAYLIWNGGRKNLSAWFWAMGLVLSWVLFSLVYFGSPFPNTFYAKLGSTAASSALMEKGGDYYYVQLLYDPVTLILIGVGCVSGLLGQKGTTRCLSIGLMLYGLYIYRIGGDFMMGRFFAVSAFVAVFVAMRTLTALPFKWSLGLCSLFYSWVCFSAFTSHTYNPWRDLGVDYDAKPFVRDVGDTRGSYFQKYGYYSPNRAWPVLGDFSKNARDDKSPLVLCRGLGAFALRTGNARYIIDQCALTDLFLARLPMKSSADFRVGHLERPVDSAYLLSRTKDQNLFKNKGLKRLYDDVELITRTDIFSVKRFEAILRFNGGLKSYGLKTAELKTLKDRIESRNLINSQFPGEGI